MKTLFIISVVLIIQFVSFSKCDGLIPIKETIPDDIREEYRANNTKSIIRGRIAYGLRALQGQFPYMAWLHMLVGSNGIVMCGATLISPTFVVTAAHCLKFEFRAIDSWYGSIDKNAFPTYRSGQSYTIHPLYQSPGSQNLEHDIGLIRLSSSVTYTPANMPTRASGSTNYEGRQVITAGWGGTELGGISQFLLFTQVIGTPISGCGTIRSDKVICGKGIGNSQNRGGDSGGPLLSGNTLIGVVSFSYGGHNGYTRVDKYLDWISSHTGIVIQ